MNKDNDNNKSGSFIVRMLEFIVIIAIRTVVQMCIINVYNLLFSIMTHVIRNRLIAHILTTVIFVICLSTALVFIYDFYDSGSSSMPNVFSRFGYYI